MHCSERFELDKSRSTRGAVHQTGCFPPQARMGGYCFSSSELKNNKLASRSLLRENRLKILRGFESAFVESCFFESDSSY